ncbi:hypothetical protein MMC22_001586 [Lobaria immixta]|nr:hypothetical protein [Lobaria immixta]
MEAFGAASTAAGLISLGITCCQGLLVYYRSWKDADETVNDMYGSIEALARTFMVLERSISNSTLNKDATQRVNESTESCKQGISALNKKLAKIHLQTDQDSRWKKRSWARLKGTLYPFKESTLMKLKERCNDLRDNLTLAVAALQVDASVTSLETLDILGEDVSELSKNVGSLLDSSTITTKRLDSLMLKQQNETSTKIYDWLSPLAGYFEQKHQEIYNTGARQEGMARWLFDTAEFKVWLKETGQTLWCIGMQGIGKSVLTSLVIDSLQKAARSKDVGIAYIYCSYKETQRQSPSNLTASLLQQLLMQQNNIPDDVVALYERHTQIKTRPLLNEYLRLLQATIHNFSRVYIIIDGLDECSEANSTRSQFLTGINNIRPQICTFVTSRYLPSIKRELPGATSLQVEANDEDIRKYLKQRLQKGEFLKRHLEKDPSLCESIIGSIVSKAQRMFLLARLYIESLTRLITLRKVKVALTNLPEGLENMYNDVLERIQGQDTELASLATNVLGWIYHAKRPLQLLELQHALAIEPEDTFLDEDGLPEQDLLISVCGGLLSVQEDNTVTFIHYTAQEYFDQRAPSLFQGVRISIAQTCLTYLLFEDLSQGASTCDDHFEARLSQYPFLEYASSYWGIHAHSQEASSQVLEDQVVNFLINPAAVSTSVQTKTMYEYSREHRIKHAGYSQAFPKHTPGLLLASLFGLSKITAILIEKDARMEEEDSRGVRAIHQAIWEHHHSVTQLLLDQGADLNAKINSPEPSLHSATIMQGSPLHLAAIRGNTFFVKLLIGKKGDVNVRLDNGWTPLHMAAANGHTPLIELLTSHGAEINAVDGHGATAIYRAAENGQEAATQMLVEHQADVNIRTKLDQTPLLRAAENGYESTVAVLLQHGADWKIKDFLGWTPLYRALDEGHDSIARRLKSCADEHRARQ